ncbi:MAG: hypothetical protein K1X31_15710 [Gemmatimonadaceae bacterium]|nr:hypothetical protein [Gemmatimonadaceae bacterium]
MSSLARTRGEIMAEYAAGIARRLGEADASLRLAVEQGDTGALMVGMAEREAALAATEDLVGELDLAGLSAQEHAAIIRTMVQSLERSQVAQAALEAELFQARRQVLRELEGPARRDAGLPMAAPGAGARSGYGFRPLKKVLGSTG